MTDYVRQAADYLGVKPDSIINPRQVGDAFVVIVDEGIAGCKKYSIPLSAFESAAYEYGDLGVYDLSYRELQAKAKAADIPANQSKDELIAALHLVYEEEEE